MFRNELKERHNIIFFLVKNTYINSIITKKWGAQILGHKTDASFIMTLSLRCLL